MRFHNLGPDPSEFSNWGGYQSAPTSNCYGALDEIRVVSPDQKIAQGWAWDYTAKRAPGKIILFTPAGVVVGSGQIDTPRPDVQAVVKLPEVLTGWSGEVQAPPGSQVRAFAVLADSKSICALNNERPVP
jgi:hypothetical protein